MNSLKIDRVIGKGGFATILLATTQEGDMKAIKKISKKISKSSIIKREVKAGQALCHNNIIKFVGHEQDSENDYLVYNYVEGKQNYFIESFKHMFLYKFF